MTRSGMILIAASATLVCGLAQAADLEVVKAEPPTIYTPNSYLWGGVYVGGFIGGGWASADWGAGTVPISFTAPTGVASLFIPHANLSTGGFVGGGRVGANYQVGPFVFGFEGDFSGMTIKGQSTVTFSSLNTPATVISSSGTTPTSVSYKTTSTYRTTADWASTFTGRVGYTFDRILAYGKGGMAIEQDGETETSTTTVSSTTVGTATTPSTISRAGTATRYGWTAGVGLEYALDNNWWTFIEYDHLGFLSQLINFVNPSTGATTTRKVQLNLDRVVGGVDYHF